MLKTMRINHDFRVLMKKRLKDVNPLINPIGACGDYRLLNESKTTIRQGITNSPGGYDDPYLAGLTTPPKGLYNNKCYHGLCRKHAF
jgi:hypothetical protein